MAKALFRAVQSGDTDKVRSALTGGFFTSAADKHALNSAGQTALMVAALHAHTDVVRLLVHEFEVDVDTANEQADGWTALFYAAVGGHGSVVRVLLEAGASPNAVDRDGATCLIMCAASSRCSVELVRDLLYYGATVDCRDGDGTTALMMAARYGRLDIVEVLLRGGANPNLRDQDRSTALGYATAAGAADVVLMLVRCGADVDMADHDGCTALIDAARDGRHEVAQLLVDIGASLECRNLETGETVSAIDLAADDRMSAILQRALKPDFEARPPSPLIFPKFITKNDKEVAATSTPAASARATSTPGEEDEVELTDDDADEATVPETAQTHDLQFDDRVEEVLSPSTEGIQLILGEAGHDLAEPEPAARAVSAPTPAAAAAAPKPGAEDDDGPDFWVGPPRHTPLSADASPVQPADRKKKHHKKRRKKRRSKSKKRKHKHRKKKRSHSTGSVEEQRPPSSSSSRYGCLGLQARSSEPDSVLHEDDHDSAFEEDIQDVLGPYARDIAQRSASDNTDMDTDEEAAVAESAAAMIAAVQAREQTEAAAIAEDLALSPARVTRFQNLSTYELQPMYDYDAPENGDPQQPGAGSGAPRKLSMNEQHERYQTEHGARRSMIQQRELRSDVGFVSNVTGAALVTGVAVGAGATVAMRFAPVFNACYFLIHDIAEQANNVLLNRDNCRFLANRCITLKGVLVDIEGSFNPTKRNVETLAMLVDEFEHTLTLVRHYTEASWLRKAVSASSIREDFERQDQRLTSLMGDLATGMTARVLEQLTDHLPYVEAQLGQLNREIHSFRGQTTKELMELKRMLSVLMAESGIVIGEDDEDVVEQVVDEVVDRVADEHGEEDEDEEEDDDDVELEVEDVPEDGTGDGSKAKSHRRRRKSKKKGRRHSGKHRRRHKHKRRRRRRPDELSSSDVKSLLKYCVRRNRIGKGTFGSVYKGMYRGSEVAIKEVELGNDDLRRMREQSRQEDSATDGGSETATEADFRQEVRMLRRLRSPRLVQYIGANCVAPHLLIVTEYAAGGNLYQLLHAPGAEERVDLELRLKLAIQVAEGLNFLHQNTPPVIHRDLKTRNILLDEHQNAKICDFGLSRTMAHSVLSTQHSTVGTPSYMAPEALRAGAIDPKSDVYSFGIVLYETFTGTCPFEGLGLVQVVTRVLVDKEKIKVPKTVPKKIKALIKACIHHKAKKRPAMTEVLEKLRKLRKDLVE